MKNDSRIDLLIMTLSTDWFRPYLRSLGIALSANTEQEFQKSCRQIVGGILQKSSTSSYYLSDLSEERRRKTKSELLYLFRRLGIEESVLEKIISRTIFEQSYTWTMDSITQDLIETSAEPDGLDRETRRLVKQLYLELCNPAFYDAIISPTTEWDQFVRKAMGDSPDSLVSFLNQELNFDPFQAFLLALRAQISAQQFINLREWYQSSALSQTGETIWWPAAN